MINKIVNERYCAYVEKRLPKTRYFPSLFKAFLVGGIICCIGQGIFDILSILLPELEKTDIQACSSVILIFIASFLTGLGVYDKIGKFGGAGSIIPITGFSNSIASPAMEYKNEGFIFGLCVKMFSIAGPVIVNGIAGSIIVGIIYWIAGLLW